jgi:hypothetical protein
VPTITPSHRWFAYFQQHSGARSFPAERITFTPEELQLLTPSLQEFQLGESGEGKHLMRQAKKYAAATGDADYLAALRLFIAEEIRHSRELETFMRVHNIPTIKKSAADAVFRTLRRLAGLELSIAVLICADIIAKVYYAALRDATRSPHLRALGEQILIDEDGHVRFQSERLAILRRHKPRRALFRRALLYPLFFRVTLIVVWRNHRRVFRAGGFSLAKFWSEAMWELAAATRLMRPDHYTWPMEDGVTAGALGHAT